MKKSILCIFLTLLMVFTALPMTATAVDTFNADTGTSLNVHYMINSDRTVTATWDSIPGATDYVLWYEVCAKTYYGIENYNQFVQVGSAVRRDASYPCTYTFDRKITLDYAFGGSDFKIEITAYSSSDAVLAEGESSVFRMDATMLSAPTDVTLTRDGIAAWSAVPNAAYYEVRVCNPSGVIQNGVTTATTTTCDVHSKMKSGNPYKVTVTACNRGQLYRNSAPSESVVVTADFAARAIDGLKWNGNTLNWTIYPAAEYYALKVYQQSGSSWNKVESLKVEKTEYDLTDVFSLYGDGTYKVNVAAYNAYYTTPRSLETDSPTKTVSGTTPLYIVSGTINSFLSDTDEVHLVLRKGSFVSAVASARVTGNTAFYTLKYVPEGVYTLFVSKDNHVTRRYRVSVSGGNKTVNVKIHPLGDVDGDGEVINFDYGRVNSHARGKSTLSGYEFDCGDIDGDEEITNFDAGKVNSHARGKSSLWT